MCACVCVCVCVGVCVFVRDKGCGRTRGGYVCMCVGGGGGWTLGKQMCQEEFVSRACHFCGMCATYPVIRSPV